MSKLVVSLLSGAFWMAAFAGVANAECTISEHFNYEGQAGVVQDNDLLRFTDDNRTLISNRQVREFRDASWLKKISSVKMTEHCKAVFWNENGVQFTFTADTPAFAEDLNDQSIAVYCECGAAHSAVHAAGEPSSGATGTAGAKGTFEFKPGDWKQGVTSWWMDSDGMAPGVAGCHIGTDSEGRPNGRMFGEACLPDGRLVESNPGARELHKHIDDTGHPDTFDCHEWCTGEGYTGGSCRAAAAPPCESSAICACE